MERRVQTRQALFSSLSALISTYENILSFHSFGSEIDTTTLNARLAFEKKLLLPRIEDKTILKAYRVNDLDKQLICSSGTLKEPNPEVCEAISLNTIQCLLVPGLGFDRSHHRIGYGKGHYDRLIAQLIQLPYPPITIGIGFKEQWVEEELPFEPHDLKLDHIHLL